MISPVRPQVFSALASLADEGELELPVGGHGSMAPLLRDGDRLLVRRQPRYRAGDLLVFRNSVGALVVHRLLGGRRVNRLPHFILRGDSSPSFDGLVAETDVLGRVVGGQVARCAFEIPLRDRLRARLRYLGYWLSRIVR